MSWVFVAGTVLTVAGTGASIAANQEADSAMHKARDAETARQAEFTKQRQATFDQSLKQSGPDTDDQQITAGVQRRENAYTTATAPTGVAQSAQGTPVAVQGSPGGSDVGASARAGAKLATSAWSRMVGGAQARLGAAGDWGQQQSIKNARASQELALNANKAQGSLAVNNYEVEHASHAGDALRDIGMVASALGSIGMAGGAAGLGTAAGAAAAPATTATQVGSAAGEAAEAAGGVSATTVAAAPSFWSTFASGISRRGLKF